MAAYGGHDATNGALQIFVVAHRKGVWPPPACDVRVKYEQTIGDVRRLAAAKLGIADAANLQLFRHKRELVPSERDDAKTLLEMDIHTGFGLRGYDLSGGVEPDYFPPVKATPHGLVIVD